ncbi:MAG: hypothetical protein LBU36_01225 [Clostridiales bacterium]|jgi:phi13 family phage major tail protein|nr:hypothetical protein [Clostridiales bacterium]
MTEFKPRLQIGVSKYTYAELLSENGQTRVYGQPKLLRGTVSIAPTDTPVSENFDGDDGVYEVLSAVTNEGHTLTNAGLPTAVIREWKGLPVKSGGVLDDGKLRTKYFCVMYRLMKTDGTYRYFRYFKGAFSFSEADGGTTRPSSGAPRPQTKEITYSLLSCDDDTKKCFADGAEIIGKPEYPGITSQEIFEKNFFGNPNWYPEDGDQTVTNVSVSGAADILAGDSEQYTATVTAENGPPETVLWTGAGGSSPGTGISENGLLSVGADETAAELTVTATSSWDETKSGSLTVSVTAA